MNAFNKAICDNLKRKILTPLICALLGLALTGCGGNTAGKTAFTTAQGPADSVLPYQAVFAVDKGADARLHSAAKSFCSRTAEFSRGSAVFSYMTSENALQDLKTGKADVILLESANTDMFPPVSESFRYKSYEHFAMAANADDTLQILSDALGASVFAGFYAGSDVFLSRGTLDSKFRPLPRKDAEDEREAQAISVVARSASTANAFTMLNGEASMINELNGRLHYFLIQNSITEFSYSELNSPELLATLREAAARSIPVAESGDESADEKPAITNPEPLTATPAFTGIKPVWLVFAPDVYEKLSQTNRAAAAEAAAYMVSDIDGVYLAYEREMLALLSDEDIAISSDFAATRILALRLADEQAANLTGTERKLREAIAKIQ